MNYLEEPLLLMNKAERDLLTMSEWMVSIFYISNTSAVNSLLLFRYFVNGIKQVSDAPLRHHQAERVMPILVYQVFWQAL